MSNSPLMSGTSHDLSWMAVPNAGLQQRTSDQLTRSIYRSRDSADNTRFGQATGLDFDSGTHEGSPKASWSVAASDVLGQAYRGRGFHVFNQLSTVPHGMHDGHVLAAISVHTYYNHS